LHNFLTGTFAELPFFYIRNVAGPLGFLVSTVVSIVLFVKRRKIA